MSKDKSVSFGVGIILGVIGGLVAGVLYSPKSGEESRQKLKETMDEILEKYNPEIQDAKKQALESVDLVRYKMERQLRKVAHSFKANKLQKAKEKEDIGYDFN